MSITSQELEEFMIKAEKLDLVLYFMELNLLRKSFKCQECGIDCKFVKFKRSLEGYAWRCYEASCLKNRKYYSVRENSFFMGFNCSLKDIMLVIVRYSCFMQVYSIKAALNLSPRTIERIMKKLIQKIPETNFESSKLGGPKFVVEIDETMLNFKCKSHRGRSPSNKTDALCIVEVGQKITRAFAKIIPNKKIETILPIVISQVMPGSVIWTDEHKSYQTLNKNGFLHQSVCHKYEFVNRTNGVNTQAVEAFHNELKLAIKKRKGVKTELRSDFLKEFCFYFNNKNNFLDAVLSLIKIN
ncbi:hypothetical protein H311_00273 [Anncaliia algerae PRA109]|nr:hypothetical protein H311_00273 [Anncaliia algerae PRA109]